MPNNTPKFQFNPKIRDVYKTLDSFHQDLHNEVDNPLPREVELVLDQLSQRDRQLEDYLTNLPTGGSGGINKIAWTYGAVSAASYSVGQPTGGGFPGVVETWQFVASSPSTVGGPAPTGLVMTTIEGNLQYTSAVGLPTNVQTFIYLTDLGVMDGVPYAANSTDAQVFSKMTVTGAVVTQPTVTLSFVAVQPIGSAALGVGAFTPAFHNVVFSQFG